ncbi:MAG: RnfABCDGE type electron transport complex subunit D [Spirochaetota bacterium]|nr:RnfABCDGE type electron transport complex subunit D [Spirochaetota bacterium]
MQDDNIKAPGLVLSNAPHINAPQSLGSIMWLVVLALTPALAYSTFIFGLHALLLIAVSVAVCVASEAAYCLLIKKPLTINDGSAVITGILLAFNVPPEAPLWMIGIGAAFAVIVAKQLFGGIGFNIFNPALAGRALLMASWPVHMTTTWHSFGESNVLSQAASNVAGLPEQAYDIITQATPLGAFKEGPGLLADFGAAPDAVYRTLFTPEMFKSYLVGNIGGCIGETSALLLLAGALLLLFRRVISWHIPFSYIGTVAAIMFSYYSLSGFGSPGQATLFHLLTGGLMLGAFFMATDMVTSPVTARGMIIFGVGCGILTCVIRLWGGYPEGVSYSILLMNSTVPLIDRFAKPKVFGTKHA